MNVELAQELVNQLSSSLENFETQHAALLQFLKDRGVVSEEQFAPYLAQAARASGVRWRAARIRLDSLIEAEKSREEAVAENEKQRKREDREASQSQSNAGQNQDGLRKDRSEGETDTKDGEGRGDRDQAGKERGAQPKTEDTGGKPAAKEREDDVKLAEQAYSPIASPEKNLASEKDKK